MRTAQVLVISLFMTCLVLFSGCVTSGDYEDLQVRNRRQQEHINDIESQLAVAKLAVQQSRNQVDTLQERSAAEIDSLKAEVAAVEEAIDRKNELISALQGQLLRGGASLPVELNVMLQDFASSNEMVSYDAGSGVVKFKSDLLFQKGSDQVAAGAIEPLKSLCKILNSKQGGNFDIIIAGHTDDIPIKKAETQAKHPTNWHLSAHRAISVLDIMTASQVAPTRISIRAFGEYRPVKPNAPNKKGNPENRRVEIYIVPAGS
jgi:chemotaxis protein MotB